MSKIHEDSMVTDKYNKELLDEISHELYKNVCAKYSEDNMIRDKYNKELSAKLGFISDELFGDIDVKYKTLNSEVPPLQKIAKGDWIDLYIATIEIIDEPFISKVKRKLGILKDYQYDKGTTLLFNLGIAMELPVGYESYITPRSSTFKKYGLILTNSIGVLDNLYKGDSDYYLAMCHSLKSGEVKPGDRLFQFRVQKNQPHIIFQEVESLGNEDRGGYGTTGSGGINASN